MIKLAQLANKLDSQGFYEEADKLDRIMSEIVAVRTKMAKIDPINRQAYQTYSPELLKISNKLENYLPTLHYKESEEILSEIKSAGIGSLLGGLGEIVKAPFSAVGRFFRDLSQGGKFKKSIDKSLKNLANIRSLIESGEPDNLSQAQQMMSQDIGGLSTILKDAYGERTFFDDKIDPTKQQDEEQEVLEEKQEEVTEEPAAVQRQEDDYGPYDVQDPMDLTPNKNKIREIINAAKGNGLIKKYSQNRGALALINDLAQLNFAIQNTDELKTAFNAWVKVLSVLNGIQHDRRPEPMYQSNNPDINDPSRGGGFDPSGTSGRPKGKDLINFFRENTVGVNLDYRLKHIINRKNLKNAVKDLVNEFPNIYKGNLQAAAEDALELRRILKPKEPNYPGPGKKWNYTT